MSLSMEERELVKLYCAWLEYFSHDVMLDDYEEYNTGNELYDSRFIDFKVNLKTGNGIIPLFSFHYDDDPDNGRFAKCDVNNLKMIFGKHTKDKSEVCKEIVFKDMNELSDWLRDKTRDELSHHDEYYDIK